ncbi:peroxyureidoacrylate/ureidoacrylate amidohydrolase RutB [Saccharopolyspora taberi]|uniref:Peroxyureidoacrylate/ureidoacrylate amidohydrolase RutB n=2 Tax=Saccharopolyspora taberi TaxID=60895 RepID=A0ABN3VJC6_9PSEU
MLLPAKPAALDLDPAESAVLVIDMQNDFGAPGGMADLAGLDIGAVRATIDPIARVTATARSAGMPVIYLQHGYRPDLADMGAPRSKNRLAHEAAGVGRTVPTPAGGTGRQLVQGTWNTEILPELAPEPGDRVLPKTRYSGFYDTDLDATLTRLGITTLVVTGCTTSVCVESTIRDAMFRDYLPVLLADCTSEPMGRANHEASLAVIERNLGWISDAVSFTATAAAPR